MGWTWGRCLGLLDADFPRSSDQTLGTGQDRNFQWQLNPCGIDSTLKMKPMEPPKSWVYGLEDAEIRTRISEFEVPSSIWIIWGCVRLSQFAAIEMTRVLSCCFFYVFRISCEHSCEVWTGVDHWGSFSLQEWQLGPNIPVPWLVSRADPFVRQNAS